MLRQIQAFHLKLHQWVDNRQKLIGERQRGSKSKQALHTVPNRNNIITYPGKSFGLKFIPNQSDLFRNLFPRQSELIRINSKKVFNLVWCNSVKNQSVSIWVNPRLWIRINPDQSFNPNESDVGILRIDSDWVFRLNHSDLEFIWIKNFFRIHSDWKSRIESDWFGLNFG